ncbi:MAG: hypothetical protein GXP39_03260 [Chloroflexi bacterium]|nr:hypothetical protein [Chloroflexota bacterium]
MRGNKDLSLCVHPSWVFGGLRRSRRRRLLLARGSRWELVRIDAVLGERERALAQAGRRAPDVRDHVVVE